MIKKTIMMLMIWSLWFTLSACSSTSKISKVSEDTLKTDVQRALDLDGTVKKLNAFRIDSNTMAETTSTARMTITIETNEAIVSGQITINYALDKKIWVKTTNDFVVTSLKTKVDPSVAKAELALSNRGYSNDATVTADQYWPTQTIFKDVQIDASTTTALFHFELTDHFLIWSSIHTYIVKATYVYGKGWQYTFDSVKYEDHTDWAGTYQLTFSKKFINADKWFVPEQVVELTIKGNLSITSNFIDSKQVTNTLSGTMVLNGETKALVIKFNGEVGPDIFRLNTDSIQLSFGPETADSLFFSLNSGMGHGGEPDAPSYDCNSATPNYCTLKKIN